MAYLSLKQKAITTTPCTVFLSKTHSSNIRIAFAFILTLSFPLDSKLNSVVTKIIRVPWPKCHNILNLPLCQSRICNSGTLDWIGFVCIAITLCFPVVPGCRKLRDNGHILSLWSLLEYDVGNLLTGNFSFVSRACAVVIKWLTQLAHEGILGLLCEMRYAGLRW